MIVSISFSGTISPDTASDTLITVASSSCSTGVVSSLSNPTLLSGLDLRVKLFKLASLASAPQRT